ncbi:MAG: hypothetical protein KDA45_09575 [Planctomycetales bacterium]|nr:hypothetical protein [Planctomycetales bacterium]
MQPSDRGPSSWSSYQPATRWALLTVLVLPCCVAGCASWSSEAEAERSGALRAPRQLNPDTVVIETVLVRFPRNRAAELSGVWERASESVLDLPLRERLDNNGLRAGVLLGELPRAIRQQLEATAVNQTSDALEHAGLAADVDNLMRQLQCRAGRRKDLMVKRELPEPLTVLTTLDGKHVCGETFERASVLFDLRAVPHGDGSASIELTPEIHHGDHRQAFVSTDFGVRPEIRRSVQVWKELKLNVKLQRGQVLMVSSTLPAKALGAAFFLSQTADHSEEHVLLLVRLAETQLDELFAPEVMEQARAMAER